MANTLSNTHRVLDEKIKDLELHSPHLSSLIRSLKVKKLAIKDKMKQVVTEQLDLFIEKEKEIKYKKLQRMIDNDKRRKKKERMTKKRKIQAYAERLDKIPLSGY
tara:strand:- start:342 stop:656 length:315 start_codon:yes stop_codon:yes gene_type:complete